MDRSSLIVNIGADSIGGRSVSEAIFTAAAASAEKFEGLRLSFSKLTELTSALYHILRIDNISKDKRGIIFIGSFPPLRKTNCKLVYIFQNILLFSEIPKETSLSYRLRIRVLRYLFLFFQKNVDEIVVQTDYVKRALEEGARTTKPIHVFKVWNINELERHSSFKKERSANQNEPILVYPSSPHYHKNNFILLEAVRKLKDLGYAIKIKVFFSENSIKTSSYLKEFSFAVRDMTLENDVEYVLGASRIQVLNAIRDANALIFPSLYESFGIPLVEARFFGTPIICSDTPWAEESCRSSKTIFFDPRCVISICDAISKFLGNMSHYEYSDSELIEERSCLQGSNAVALQNLLNRIT